MKYFLIFATILICSSNCSESELHSAVEELINLLPNEALLIKEMKKLTLRMEHAMEMIKK